MSDRAENKPTLIVARRLPEAVEARLAAGYTAHFAEDRAAADLPALARAHDAAAMLVAPGVAVTEAVIDALPPSVRIIATFSVGTDHIALAAAERRGIAVTNTPDVLTDATADLTLLLILAASRRASEGERLLRAGGWTGWTPTQLMGQGLAGRRLGIVGMGRIGQAVAARARIFGLNIHYHGRRALPETEARGARFHARLEDLLAVSDILSLHCPLTPETRGLIDAERLARLPPQAILINTGRPPVRGRA